jgi:hypothetical protein
LATASGSGREGTSASGLILQSLRVNFKVVHSRWEITEDDQTVSFGLEFSGTQKEIESNLKSLVGTLDSVEVTEDLFEA